MDKIDQSDAISLHTIAEAPNFEDADDDEVPRSESPRTNVASGSANQDEFDVPAIFKTSPVLIKSPPVLSSMRLDKGFLNTFLWRLSHPFVAVVVLWSTILFHGLLIGSIREDRATGAGHTDSTFIATVLVVAVASILYNRIHRINQSIESLGLLDILPFAIWSLILVCVIGPLLSLPILEFHNIVNETITDPAALSCATLSSWSQVLPNLKGSLPYGIASRNSEGSIEDLAITSTDLWVVKDNANNTLSLDPITFNLPQHGKGAEEKLWNGPNAGSHDGVYMPIAFLSDPDPDGTHLSRTLRVGSQVLAMSLKCEIINDHEVSKVEDPEGKSILSVEFQDSDHCATTVNLTALNFDQQLYDAFKKNVRTTEYNAHNNDDPVQKRRLLEFVDSYDQELLRGTHLSSYVPGWARLSSLSRTNPKDRRCEKKLAIVAPSRLVTSVDSYPKASQLEVASCYAEYFVADVDLVLTKENKGRFHTDVQLSSRSPQTHFDDVSYPNKTKTWLDDYISIPWFPQWTSLDEGDQDRLSEAFLQSSNASPLRGTQWLFPLFREQLGDIIWDRPHPVGSLLMAGKVLRHSFISQISTAAGLALEEELATGLLPDDHTAIRYIQGQSLNTRRLKETPFQSRTSSKVWLYLISALLTISVFITTGRPRPRAQAPWDFSSIAARAALLRHSPFRDWLAAYKPALGSLKSLMDMRIGYWRIHEKQGQSGWRIDSEVVHLPEPRASQKQKMSDSYWSAYIVYLGYAMLLTFVVYFILLWVPPARWSQPVEHEFAMFHIISKNGIHLRRSFWSILWQTILPSSLVFFCAFFWLPLLYHFIRCRQPWVSLKAHQTAEKSITLDYWNFFLPLPRAVRNGHWTIVALATAQAVSLFVPYFQATLRKPDTRVDLGTAVPLVYPRDWATDITHPDYQADANYALKGLLENLQTKGAQSLWSSGDTAMISPTVEHGVPEGTSTLWKFPTSALRAHLTCEELPVEVISTKTKSDASGDLLRIEDLEIRRSIRSETRQIAFHKPCSLQQVAQKSYTEHDITKQSSVCTRWWLDGDVLTDAGDHVPLWVIASLNGSAVWSDKQAEMLFEGSPSAVALGCRPTITKESGEATLYSFDGSLSNVMLIKYEPSESEPEPVSSELVTEICQGLNSSNSFPSTFDDGLMAQDDLIHTGKFVGDTLSYALYRFGCVGAALCKSTASLHQDVSQIFGTYVAILGRSDTLTKTSAASPTGLQPFQVVEFSKLSATAAAFLGVFYLFAIVILVLIQRQRGKLRLPFSPEPLVNGLLLLCESSIVTTLEREIPHPELLTLRSFYEVVNSWGYTYKLGQLVSGELSTSTIDVTAIFGDEGEHDSGEHDSGEHDSGEHDENYQD